MYDFEKLITDVPGYPKEGVIFKDITTLLANGEGFGEAIRTISEHFADKGVTKIIGSEARGFMIGAPVAIDMGVGFVPARKPGKLPRETIKQSYDLEYGSDSLEIHADAVGPEDIVLIVDDLIATGGTAIASAKLAQAAGAKIAGFAFLLELTPFEARKHMAEIGDAEFFSLVQVDEY